MGRPGSDSGRKPAPNSTLHPETKHGLAVLFLFTAALIIGLALLQLAGVVGGWLQAALVVSLGNVAYLVPVVLLILAYLLLLRGTPPRLVQGLGGLLCLIGITGLLQTALSPADRLTSAHVTAAGGYLGFVTAVPLIKALGLWGAIVLLLALAVSGCLVLFETSLQAMAARVGRLGRMFGQLGGRLALPRPAPPTQQPTQESESDEEELTPRPRLKLFQSRVVEGTREPEQLPLIQPKVPVRARQVSVPLDLLEDRTGKAMAGDITAQQEKIRTTLANFGIEVEMAGVNVGPTVTQYTLKPAEGVKLASITALSNDLALALAAHPIRIEAPIPGQSLVGIEVPNQTVAVVGLKEILQSEAFKRRRSQLTAALGKDVAGAPWVIDIERMPHLLIAGATGSGKSVCINSILLSLLYTNSPDELKFIIVDPKRVELASYNDIPHLLTPVVTEVAKTINALKWVVGEMDRRYHVLQQASKRNIVGYNESAQEKLPYLLVVIDELADLMAVAASDVEAAIIRLAQMARAVGIHLIVATQRPSVDVITGLIKANITSRIAFAVASGTDSRTILDTSGAEKLLGRGDCLFISAELSKPKRIQAALVGDAEIERVVEFLKASATPDYNPEVVSKQSSSGLAGGGIEDGGDDLLDEARSLVVRSQKASASYLQRRLRVGYARAARLLDLLEERGVIGPGEGAKPREVMVPRDSLDDGYAPSSDDAEDAEEAAPTSEATVAPGVDGGDDEA